MIVGTTTPAFVALPGLDTTSIGGTDYTNAHTYPANMYPQWYMAVGVGGVPAGQAYEIYSVNSPSGAPFQYWPDIEGLMAQGADSAFSFHPSYSRPFVVSPNDPAAGKSLVTIDWQNYTAPGTNGFWLLLLDRVLMQPIDLNKAGGTACVYNAGNNDQCGQFFNTGSSNAATAAQAINNLTAALANLNQRDLIILTTAGTPFNTGANPTAALGSALEKLGGSGYALNSLAGSTAGNETYTLITANDPKYSNALTGKAVLSSSALTAQQQTGYVRGLLLQNNHGLYSPAMYSQESASTVADGNEMDYSFYQLANAQPGPWPDTDTLGHIAAYQALSTELVQKYLQGATGDHLNDIRYYYTGFENTKIAGGTPDPTDTVTFAYPGDGKGFTAQEWSDVAKQLSLEKAYLGQSIAFFSQVRPIIAGAGSGAAFSLINAASEVQASVLSPSSGTDVSVNVGNVLNLAAGIEAFAGIVFPENAAGFGVLNSILWSASALAGGFTDSPDQIPNADYTFTTSLAQLSSTASTQVSNMQASYDMSVDDIYSDWNKLSIAGQKVVDTNPGGWYLATQVAADGLQSAIDTAARRSFFLQILPNYYSIDFYENQPTNDPDSIGSPRKHAINTAIVPPSVEGTTRSTAAGLEMLSMSLRAWTIRTTGTSTSSPAPSRTTTTSAFQRRTGVSRYSPCSYQQRHGRTQLTARASLRLEQPIAAAGRSQVHLRQQCLYRRRELDRLLSKAPLQPLTRPHPLCLTEDSTRSPGLLIATRRLR